MNNKIFTKVLLIASLAIALSLPEVSSAGTVVSIDRAGNSVVNGALVSQIAGSTLFMRMIWGDAYVRITVKTTPSTVITRNTGEKTTVAEIKEGDYLNLEGTLESGSNSLTLVATKVKDTSIDKKQTTVSGKIISIDKGAGSIQVATTKYGSINLKVDPGISIIKGPLTIDISRIMAGDYIDKAVGDYDFSKKVLNVSALNIYIDLKQYESQNRDGKITAISSNTLPTTMTVLVGDTTFTVNLPSSTRVLNNAKSEISLQRFVVGDKVRIYGKRRLEDNPVIDAEVIRNYNL